MFLDNIEIQILKNIFDKGVKRVNTSIPYQFLYIFKVKNWSWILIETLIFFFNSGLELRKKIYIEVGVFGVLEFLSVKSCLNS